MRSLTAPLKQFLVPKRDMGKRQFVCSGVLVFFSAIEINLHQRPKSWLKAELKRILTVYWQLNGLEIGAEYYRIWIDVP